MSDVCLHSLEALDAVVKSGICGVKFKWFICLDQWSLPTAIVYIVINLEHVVCGQTSECILMICGWLGLQSLTLLNLDVFHLLYHKQVMLYQLFGGIKEIV